MDAKSTVGAKSRVTDAQRDAVINAQDEWQKYREFQEMTFTVLFNPGSIKINRHGDIEASFTLPKRFGDRFEELQVAARFPLNVHITKWKPDGTDD